MQSIAMRILGIVCAFLLSNCAGGEAGRWIAAENRTVTVEGIPYQVIWVRDGNGIDMRGVRAASLVMMPDAMVERRRNTQAAMIVGTDLCAGNASVVAEMNDGDFYTTRIRCG
jgi:hypothetical protein